MKANFRSIALAALTGTLAVLIGTLAACKVGPNFTPPHEAFPAVYAGVADRASAPDGAAPSGAPAADPNWWHQFQDDELDRLEAQASSGNLDLKASYLRIVEARIEVQAARAQGLPALNASAKYTREQLGLAGIVKSQHLDSGTGFSMEQGLISALEKPISLYQLGFDASWEIDLFGRVRRAVEAADAQSLQAVETRNDMLVSLQAEVAQEYLQMRAAQVLRNITMEMVAAQKEILGLIENRRLHGLAGEGDVESARAQLSSLEAQLPPFEESIATSRHALAVLCGQDPAAFDTRFGAGGELPSPPAIVAVGLPSTLARRRPDIRNSEAALHAATAQIGVSVAQLYPDISLTGTLGLRNTETNYLFNWASKFYTFGPNISVPLFHGGALIANVRLSRTEAAAAALAYRKTVLNALQEVEDGLTSVDQDAQRNASLRSTVGADQRAVEIEIAAYRRGLVTYVNVLTLQLQTIQARQQLAQALLDQSVDLVKLYKALGGGWQAAPDVAQAD